MSRTPIPNWVDLNFMFDQVQHHMSAHLASGDVFDHPSTCGAAAERGWIHLLTSYLPQRYRATPAFIVDADGHRSFQIDIAVYDHFYSPLIFPHESGVHIPAESVYAVFEVKQAFTRALLADAGRKVASVRALRRTSAPVISGGAHRRPIAPPHILSGILALRSAWDVSFQQKIASIVPKTPPAQRLDFGCALGQCAFELYYSTPARPKLRFSTPKESLIFFLLRLLDRLRALGTAPAIDLMQYGRSLDSFGRPR